MIIEWPPHSMYNMKLIFKKYTTLFIIICFSNLNFNCNQTFKKTYTNSQEFHTFSNEYDIHVITNDSLIYFFRSGKYQFDNTAIKGFATIMDSITQAGESDSTILKSEMLILSYDDISRIIRSEQKKKSLPDFNNKTFIMISLGFIGLILIILLIKKSTEKDQNV